MSALDAVASDLDGIDGVEVERNAPSGPLCTYRVGGPIAVLARVSTGEALAAMAALIAGIPGGKLDILPIGKGSNLLISDAGFPGVGVLLDGDAFTEIRVAERTDEFADVVAGASAPLPLVARATVREQLTGFEWAVGVPGTIGGGVRMNAGGHGSDMSANLRFVSIVDLASGEQRTLARTDLELGYRTSNIAPNHLVTSATLRLGLGSHVKTEGEKSAGEEMLSEIVRWRRANQPGGQNAGSVFTNPADDSAGRLIDAAGLKGYRIGSAEVSTVHANFIQVDPNGSADDVMALMREMVTSVEATFRVRLHAETRLIGFADDDVECVQATVESEQKKTS